MKIRILAAADRNNYGDLLFPLILREVFTRKIVDSNYTQIINYGIRNSNLQNFGALKTLSYKVLEKEIKTNDLIIIAGGEVLGGGWMNILRFFSSFWNKLYRTRITRGVLNKSGFVDSVFFLLYGSSKPFVLDGKSFRKAKIAYSSVGALGINSLMNKQKYRHYFENINLFSVRDKVSLSKILAKDISCNLVPDSAIIMSDLFTDTISHHISKDCENLGSMKYIFLQFGNNKEPDNLDKFIVELKTFSDRNNMSVILCPIGMALDHDDEVILRKIKKKEPAFIYFKPENLYETMFLLKNTSLYLGTSLHGFITAQSFNRPFFVFDEKVNKNEQYMGTWGVATTKSFGNFHDFDSIQKRIDKFDGPREKSGTDKQKRLVYDNLQRIFSL